ncbi:MAG: YDG domain-containing protein, partial [Gallionella sp.]|nr:YDG domain-containing protein [Gallionella sp.]
NAAGAVFTGLVGGDTVTVGATGTFSDKNVANGKTVTLASTYGGADAGNYAITDQASTTANITPKAMSVSGIVASNKVYDGTTAATVSAAGAVLTGLVGGDAVTVGATGTFVDKNAGNGKTVTLASSYGGTDAGNYTIIDQANTTADITPKGLTVAANADTKFHDGAAYAGGNGVTYAGFVAGETEAVLGGALTYGGTSQGATAVGSYTITPGGLASGNYALNFVDGALTINASAAPVEAQNAATQVVSQVLAGSVVVPVSPTITISRVAGTAPAKQDNPIRSDMPGNSAGNTTQNNTAQSNTTENDGVENEQAESEHREVVNVAMNFNRGGPTLRIMNGGMRLPVRYGQQNE